MSELRSCSAVYRGLAVTTLPGASRSFYPVLHRVNGLQYFQEHFKIENSAGT